MYILRDCTEAPLRSIFQIGAISGDVEFQAQLKVILKNRYQTHRPSCLQRIISSKIILEDFDILEILVIYEYKRVDL